MELNSETSNEKFKKLSNEEFESLSEDEKPVYIKNYNIHMRKLFDDFHSHIEEMKKTVNKLNELKEEKFE